MEKNEILALLALHSLQIVPKGKIKELRKKAGNLSKLFLLSKTELEELGLSIEQIDKLKKINLQIFNRYANDSSLKIVTLFDEDYPQKLKNIINPPLFLFLKGNAKLLDKKMLSIVGTRAASNEAIEWGKKAAETIVSQGYAIVSGGAIGIDKGAHEGALCSNETNVCVLGGGVNNPYPKENVHLFNKIVEQGGLLVSETLPDEPVNRYSLLLRNRITSALSEGMLIVASKEKGGAMWQSKVGVLQKKPIFCPSPSLGLMPSEGPNQLINKGIATPIQDPSEIVTHINKISAQTTLNI